jgi:outer membrane protein assembly factor BamB
MKKNPVAFVIVAILAFFIYSENACSQEKNWTAFRGSNLDGIATSTRVPLKWDDSSIKWKTEIHDRGLSSPVVFGNQVWVTTAKTDGTELYAVAVDFNTGKIIYDISVFTPGQKEGKHSLNSYATPTPCVEKNFAYVHYGSFGTACINTSTGLVIWKVTDLKCKHVQGPASSPVLYKNLIILHFEGTDMQYIVALDKATGKIVWRTDRPKEPYEPLTVIGRKAYITPIIINVKGRDMLISNGSALCQALDPNTGEEIWRVVLGAESTIAMPFTEKGIVYWYAGYEVGPGDSKFIRLLAVNPDGKGDITGTNILWERRDEMTRNHCLTPLIKDGLIYTINTRNMMMCIDAGTGKEVWSQHMTSNFDASPIYVNGTVWFFSVKGDVIAIKAGRKYEVVAQNKMDSAIWATPAFLRNSVILRTDNWLTRIGN